MDRSLSRRLSAVLAAFVVIASAAAMLVASLDLIGWSTRHERLTMLFATRGPTMNPATAIAALLAGAALVLVRSPGASRRARIVAHACAACTTIIGTLRLVGYLVALPVNVDEVMFASQLSDHTFGASRMATPTALGFAAIGAALLMLDVETRRRRGTAHLLAAVAATIGVFGVTSYLFIQAPFCFGRTATAMAPNTAFVMMLLSVGTLCARPSTGWMRALTRQRPGSALVRRVLIPAAGFAWLFCWLGLIGAQAAVYETEVGFALAAVSIIVIAVVIGCRAADEYDRVDAARRRAEDDLRDRESEVRAILDHSEALVFVKDMYGRYTFANRALGRAIRIPPTAFIGHTDHDIFPAAMADVYRANDARVLTRGEAIQFEENAVVQGRELTYVVVKFPLRSEDGRPTALCGIATDITARKRSETAAARLRDRIATTNRVLAVLTSADEAHWYEEVLAVVCRCFDSESGVFGHVGDGAPPASESWPAWIRRWACLLDEPSWVRDAVTGVDGTIHRSLGSPLRHRGVLLGVLQVADCDRDYDDDDVARMEEIAAVIAPVLTARLERTRVEIQRRESEEELRQLARRLQAANEGLESFTYSISHDLRAPLRAIGGFAKILSTEHAASLDAEGRRLLGIVSDNTRRMTRLVDDLLMFARVDRRELVRRPVDVESVVAGVVAETQSAHPDRPVVVRVGPLPSVSGDTNLLRQVFANLIGNAWKFTRDRSDATIEIAGRVEDDEIVFTVRDNGAGFDMRYVRKLFGVFQRLHTEEEFDGTGVGLALVRRIVERHGGRVWATGQVAIGATFSFALPRRRETEDEATYRKDAAGRG